MSFLFPFFSFFFHLTYRQTDTFSGQVPLLQHGFQRKTSFPPSFSLLSNLLPRSQHGQTGQRGQVEVDHSLAAMCQTAEVRSRMLQLLLWHPEKWETQDVRAKPSVAKRIGELFFKPQHKSTSLLRILRLIMHR